MSQRQTAPNVQSVNAAYHYLAAVTAELPENPPDSIVSRTLHSDAQMKVILFGFAAGQELSEHTSARSVLLHFLAGKADLKLGDDPHSAEPGTLVHMPPHLPHSVYAVEPTYMLLIQVENAG